MRKAMQVLVILVAAMIMLCVMAMTGQAAEIIKSGTCGADGDNVTWMLDDEGTLTISGTGAMKNYVSYGSSLESPFSDNRFIKSVIIEKGVTSIGSRAFRRCSLTSVTIPDSVTSIGESAFWYCSLTSVTIPDSITSIGESAFSDCCSLTSVTIPDSVTSIGESVFRRCSSLTSVTIPDRVRSIGSSAFAECEGLISVTMGNEVRRIGEGAFEDCSSLTGVYITDLVAWCNISFEIGISKCSNPLSYAHNLYLNNELVTDLTIPDSVTSIGDVAFSGCRALTSVTIPDGVTSIGDSAFSRCSSLTSVTIPDSVTSIGNSAFWYCSSLTGVTIPDSVTSIDINAFRYCSSLTSVTIGAGVRKMGSAPFTGCNSLTGIWVNENNHEYCSDKKGVLYNKAKTELIQVPGGLSGEYNIPSSIKRIGGSAFSNCSNLTSVTIPNGVESIDRWTFWNCSSLTSITIPSSVTSIGDYAFGGCDKLTDVYFGGSELQWRAVSIGVYDNDSIYYDAKIHYNNVSSIYIEKIELETEYIFVLTPYKELKDCFAYAAAYDVYGRLIDEECEELSGTKIVKLNVKKKHGGKAKVFIWDKDMQPLNLIRNAE